MEVQCFLLEEVFESVSSEEEGIAGGIFSTSRLLSLGCVAVRLIRLE